ncbi:hypothetical protein [Peribacillus sp. SCS-155]|uniref:hypothetical protein n=1 Tax=Peribacillus sedimenti TaxID=3115297 RepID=UPI003905BBFA
MWELLFEIDYNAIPSMVSFGLFLTTLLPFAAYFFFDKRESRAGLRNKYSRNAKGSILEPSVPFEFEFSGFFRYIICIRRKEGTADTEEPFSLIVC